MFERRKIKDSMNVQKEKEKSGRLMRGEKGAIVEDSFEKIQEQKQDNEEEEEEVSSI